MISQAISFGRLVLSGLVAASLVGCGGSGGGDETAINDTPDQPETPSSPPTAVFQELFDQGVDRYIGVFAPMTTEVMQGGVTTYTFDGSSGGPMCFTGNPYSMSTLDGTSSELMIFLQGGGSCSPNGCDAVDAAFPITPPAFGILNAADPSNPVAEYNWAYLPYCDGSLWMGDAEVDSNGDGVNDRMFRGLKNLSASLDVVAGTYPSPSRIFITGNSAGGFGTHAALPLVRRLYPGVPIELINDSGVGIASVDFGSVLNDYWNAGAFFPESCDNCIGDDGNLTEYYVYQMAEDQSLRVGFMSTEQDAVVTSDGPEFERQLREAVAELSAAHPQRFRSMIAEGDGHTFIIRDFDRSVGGTTVRQWVTDMLAGSDEWESVSE